MSWFPKNNGSVHLSGDYYCTPINPAIDVNHSMPTAQDFSSTLAGGRFSPNWLVQTINAHQHLVLNESSHELVTIKTQRGLFRLSGLPFRSTGSL